jgi:hypothetical protein
MKHYIIYYDNITRYGISDSGYYVGYRDKLSDKYSNSYLFAKKYKTLGPVLNRLNFNCTGYNAINIIRQIHVSINNSLIISRRKKLLKLDNKDFNDNITNIIDNIGLNFFKDARQDARIEVIEIDGDHITNLGKISNLEVYNFIKKEADKFAAKSNIKIFENKNYESEVFTEKDVDDFCYHVDNILNEKKI